MDVIIAARLSKKVGGRAQGSIESQDEDAREWAESEGHHVVATVADVASGTKAMRQRKHLGPWVTQPDLMAKYQAIVAAKQDRLSRADWRDEGDLRRWAEDNGKVLIIVERNLRWPPREGASRDEDIARWNRGAEDAHHEWNVTSRRYRRMIRQRTANNELAGKPIYGFRSTGIGCGETPCSCWQHGKDDHKTLTAYEPEAAVVREAVTRYLAGESLRDVCDDLNARGIPSPTYRGKPGKCWYPTTLGELLRNPSIAGRRMNAEGKTILRYEGIATWKEHEQLTARLDSRANRKGISPQNSYLLTGIIYDETGSPMWGLRYRGRAYSYYRSQETGRMVRADFADAKVDDLMTRAYGDEPHEVARVRPASNHSETIARLRQDRAELDDLADNYETRHAELTAEIRRLVADDRDNPKQPGIEWVDSGETTAQHWRTIGTAARRDWLREHGWLFVTYKRDSRWWVDPLKSGRAEDGRPITDRATIGALIRAHMEMAPPASDS
jgi:hypothetical protein